MIHELKTWPEYFEEVFMDHKKFEIRKDDRNYQVGDHLILKEWEPKGHFFTGRELTRVITYVLRDTTDFGLKEGYCLMSIG